jgi:salicylate hydroxylase
MPTAGRTVFIAGAGIAGLTLALALAKFGAMVVVLERNPAIQEFGAGLQLSPNARRVLNQLGLDRALTVKSFEPEGIDLYPFGASQPLTTLTLGAAVREQFGAPYAVMHRGDLAEVLFRATRRFANIDIVFGVENFDVTNISRGVSVTIREQGGRSRQSRAFAFVGADGVNSHTRNSVLGGVGATYMNYVAWRALVDFEPLRGVAALDKTSLFFGPGYHAVCYPLPHRKTFNIALFAKEARETAFGLSPRKQPSLPASALRSPAFAAIISAAKERWGYWPVATVETQDWHRGGIGLIGDAAHAMLPFQAQGAAMGIEDAAILAPLLMTELTGESAFNRFAAMRRPRVQRVQKLSIENGRAFHMDWPLSLARDLVIRTQGPTGHFRRLDWLYGFDAAPEVEMPARSRAL